MLLLGGSFILPFLGCGTLFLAVAALQQQGRQSRLSDRVSRRKGQRELCMHDITIFGLPLTVRAAYWVGVNRVY